MAEFYFTLGRWTSTSTGSTGAAAVYQVTTGRSAIVSSITVCDRAGAANTFSISISTSTGAAGVDDYIAYQHPIGANEVVVLTAGYTMADSDEMRAWQGTTGLTIQAHGMEITA